MPSPLISIIIPALNEEILLPLLLEDLLPQLTSEVEVFVVDGGSTDKTQAIVQTFHEREARIRLIISPQRGVGIQRNLGAQQAHSSYLLFFDADNRIPSSFISEITSRLQSQSPSIFTNYCTADTTHLRDRTYTWILNHCLDLGVLFNMPFALGACLGCSREVFTSLHGFDPLITYMEDTELVQRFRNHGYRLFIFHSPRFILSLRRFRKEGLLRQYVLIIPYILQLARGKKITTPVSVYPMEGGGSFPTTAPSKQTQTKPILD